MFPAKGEADSDLIQAEVTNCVMRVRGLLCSTSVAATTIESRAKRSNCPDPFRGTPTDRFGSSCSALLKQTQLFFFLFVRLSVFGFCLFSVFVFFFLLLLFRPDLVGN